jgi:carbon-monoxide dehydrogenase small subunit
MRVTFTLNNRPTTQHVEPRDTLADHLRDQHGLTALHLGCESGACGACTVNLDGKPIRSCLILTALCEGRHIDTLEGLHDDPLMQTIKRCFHEEHALQCGYCTPGMLMTARDIIQRHKHLDEKTIRNELAGQICRCTGYTGIVNAILKASKEALLCRVGDAPSAR